MLWNHTYWVPQKLPQICTVIAYICIGKVAWFAVYICGNLWNAQYVQPTFRYRGVCPSGCYERVVSTSIEGYRDKFFRIQMYFLIFKNPYIYYLSFGGTVWPRSIDPFYILSYYIKWITTLWTYSSSKAYTLDLITSKWIHFSWSCK